MQKIDVTQEQEAVIEKILKSYFPKAVVYVFGSRADGRAKTYSDLDLAIDTGEKISLEVLFQIQEVFSQTNIPFKIDLLDLNAVGPEFKTHIVAHGKFWS